MRDLRLPAFLTLALLSAFLLWQGQNTKTRVVEIEARERVNTCVDEAPRACQRLLNRLLMTATPAQRQRIRWAARHNADLLKHPKVRSSKQLRANGHIAPTPPATDTGSPPNATEPSTPTQTTPEASKPSEPPPSATTTTTPSEPNPSPEPDPPPDPPTKTVPVPIPDPCQPLPDLPVC